MPPMVVLKYGTSHLRLPFESEADLKRKTGENQSDSKNNSHCKDFQETLDHAPEQATGPKREATRQILKMNCAENVVKACA